MDVPATLIAAFPPSADLLLDCARRHIDDAMLVEIASADYGADVDTHLRALQPIRDQGIVPTPMAWHPGEVLELIRWPAPEDPAGKPWASGRRDHQMRVFACAVLLRAGAEATNEGYNSSDDSSLAQCIASAKVVGEEMSEAAARFLTWRIPRMEKCSEPPLFALGLLILATRLRSGRIKEPDLGIVAEWVIAEEWLHRRTAFPSDPADSIPFAFSVQSGFWRPLAAELLQEVAAISMDDVRTNLQACALLLDPGCNG